MISKVCLGVEQLAGGEEKQFVIVFNILYYDPPSLRFPVEK